jgi:valyl-tRNA synthetase
MKAEVASATLQAPEATQAGIRAFEADLKSVGRIHVLGWATADEISMTDVVLAEQPEA